MDIVIPTIPWVPLLPHTILAVAGTAILLADCFLPRAQRGWLAALALAGVAAAALAVRGVGASPAPLLGGMVVADGFARFFHLVYLMVAALTILLSAGYLHREDLEHGEYYALILFATLGMMIMAGSLDLITIFLGLETLSIPLYILAGFQRTGDKSNESAIKYLLLGAFATGFFLYGVALVYGATGTTKLAGVAGALKAGGGGGILLSLGAGLLVVGLGFKVAAVPFHMWTPDVYEGAPTSVTAFMIAGTKAAAFAALLRVLFFALPSRQADWVPILSVLAVLTMIVGNVAAIAQQNIKRMLAYSSIAHAGYVLVALASAGRPDAVPNAAASALFYLIVYALMNLGAFAVIIALTERGESRLGIADFAGLGARHPFLGCAMAVFMLSLAGFPPTGGFMGKFYIFSAAVQGQQVGLAVVGVLTSVISVYYYLRVTVVMYMREPAAEPGRGTVTPGLVLAAAVAAVGTLYLGLLPARWWELAQQSVKALLG